MELKAGLLPFSGGSSRSGVRIDIYVVTGRHGIIRVPESFCKECNLFYRAAKKGAEMAEEDVSIDIRSYWTRFLRPALKGGIHPPVMMVAGEVISQGYDVPDPERVAEAVEAAAE